MIAINTRLFLLLFPLLAGQSSFGQERIWMQDQDKKILQFMNIQFQKPGFYKEVMGFECFDTNLKLKHAFTCNNHKLISDDGESVIFMPISRIFTEEDSVRINKIFKGSIKSLNTFHIGNIRQQLKVLINEQAVKDWKEYVKYYSAEETKNKFNADTAISYSLALNDDIAYDKKYDNVHSIFLQKRNKGFINIIVFYSDKIKDRIDQRLIDIEKMIRYKD